MKKSIVHLFIMSVCLLSVFVYGDDNKSFVLAKDNNDSYKIVFLIAPPRSLSTAFLRMMENRGDFKVIQEPSFTDWRFKREQFTNMLLDEVKKSHVFVKELSYATNNLLLDNMTLLKRDNVYFIFLTRNPHHSIISMYKHDPVQYENTVFASLCGYGLLKFFLEHVKQHAKNPPTIVQAEDFYTKPAATVKAISHYLGIEYKPESLQWQALGDTFQGQTWNNIQHESKMKAWHHDVLHSTGIHKPHEYKTDSKGNPTFEELSAAGQQACRYSYEQNMPFYVNLMHDTQYLLPIVE